MTINSTPGSDSSVPNSLKDFPPKLYRNRKATLASRTAPGDACSRNYPASSVGSLPSSRKTRTLPSRAPSKGRKPRNRNAKTLFTFYREAPEALSKHRSLAPSDQDQRSKSDVPLFTVCDWTDEFCDCSDLGTICCLLTEENLCARHYSKRLAEVEADDRGADVERAAQSVVLGETALAVQWVRIAHLASRPDERTIGPSQGQTARRIPDTALETPQVILLRARTEFCRSRDLSSVE